MLALAKTSATRPVQSECAKSFRPFGYSCVFSQPVDSQKQRIDRKISRRGLSAGTAIISRVPIRQFRKREFPSPQFQSRLQAAIVQLGSSTVLMGTLYGFQQNQRNSKQNANRLVREAAGPSILLGDFNHDLIDLDAWTLLRDAGFIDSLILYEKIHGVQMPPTYQEATRRDLAIFSNELAHIVTDVHVISCFPRTSPSSLHIDVSQKVE